MDEMTITESLSRMIDRGERAGAVTTEIQISDAAARELARALCAMQLEPAHRASEIYRGMKAGAVKFKGRAIVVADA